MNGFIVTTKTRIQDLKDALKCFDDKAQVGALIVRADAGMLPHVCMIFTTMNLDQLVKLEVCFNVSDITHRLTSNPVLDELIKKAADK